MDIEEASVPFDIDRPLTEEELKQNIEYNKADVDATERLFHARKNYLYSKVRLGRQVGLKGYESLRLTNGKLSARYLNAKPIKRNDERDFKYPDTLNKENIDDKILQFFNQMWDKSIPSDKLFKSKLKIRDDKNDMDIIYGFGGVHGATPNYIGESTEDRVLLLYDVSSLYPSLMIEYDLLSRNVPNPEEFEIIYKNRFKAKREGDKETSDDLKLILNTSYGITLNKYSDMFDPRQGRMICIYGQLLLTDLKVGMEKVCPTIKVLNFNTDGILFELDKTDFSNIAKVFKEWENRTRLNIEGEKIEKLIQKDVNNYIMVNDKGKVTVKGSMLRNYHGGSIENNSLQIVHKALGDKLLYDKDIRETIENCDDIHAFQMITVTGRTYKNTYHEIDGEMIEVQGVNRVYATNDDRYGTIYKYKQVENKDGEMVDRYDKIANIPENSIIDNKNELSIEDIDKEFYIDMATKRYEMFIRGDK